MNHFARLALLSLAGLVGLHGLANAQTAVTLDKQTSKTPASWKSSPPENKFRAYQFKLPKAGSDKDDAELVIFFFGPGGGGGVDENIKRWKDMVTPPQGKTSDDVSKVEKFKVGETEMTYLQTMGTYKFKFPPFDPNAKVTLKEGYKLLGVVTVSENGPYFIRVIGPAGTVDSHKGEFEGWLKNFK